MTEQEYDSVTNKLKHKSIKYKIYIVLKYLTIGTAIYASATPISSLYYTHTALVFFFSSILLFLFSRKGGVFRVKKSGIREVAILIGLITSTAIINFDSDFSYYLGIMVLIMGAYFMTISIDYKIFEIALVRTFTFISIVSCLITIFLNTHQAYTIHLPRLVTETRTGSVSWGNFYYVYFVWDYWGRFGFIRNSACFREPGVWGAFCILVLGIKALEMKNKNNSTKRDIFQFIVLSIGTLSSFSTTAIICFIVCMYILFYNGKQYNLKHMVLGLCATAAIIVLIYNFKDVLFSKFASETREYKAYVDRFAGIKNSIEAFLTNPVLGAGYTNYYKILQGLPLTVTFAVILGEFGILGMVWFLTHLVSFSKMITNRFSERVFFLLLLIIILFAQNLIFTPLFLFLILYASSVKKKAYREYSLKNKLVIRETQVIN